jgi:nucleotide-binding universal stress UspA family protein
MAVPPVKLLLATDFSARCDRALDRALQLMKQFDAELIILHVIEPSNEFRTFYRKRLISTHSYADKLAEKARHELKEFLPDNSGRINIIIKKGDTADIILETASKEKCDLIICGVARDVMLGHHTLGKTVNRLLRRSDISMLIVTDRMSRPYSKILAASDISGVSAGAIKTALTIFKDRKIDILFAEEAYGSHALDGHNAFHEQIKINAQRDFNAFIDSAGLSPHDRERINIIIEWGKPAPLVQEFVDNSSTDLVIMGSRKRNPVASYFFESIAKRIVSVLSCDALVIRESQDS